MEAETATATRAATIAELVAAADASLDAAGVGTPRLDAELLLAAACEVDRTALCVRASEPVPSRCAERFRSLLARRVRREPLQYIVGHQEFWSLDFTVNPNVLIPRPETELLVELAIGIPFLPPFEKGGRVGICSASSVEESAQIPLSPPFSKGATQGRLQICDVGTGSGCIAVALARELPSAEVWALDVSMRALAVAELNAHRLGVAERIRFLRSDLFAAVAHQRFNLIVANPPYLTEDDFADLQPELAYEPRAALDGGADGLSIIRHLLAAARDRLVDDGWFLMEIGAEQAVAVESLARSAGFSAISVRADYAGLPRVLMARR